MEKETFDKMVEFLAPIGINKSDLYDLLTYNLQEVLSVAFLGITTMLPSIKKDKKKLITLRGVMAASGVFGNPLALIFLLITLVHSIIKGNTKQFKKDLTSKANPIQNEAKPLQMDICPKTRIPYKTSFIQIANLEAKIKKVSSKLFLPCLSIKD